MRQFHTVALLLVISSISLFSCGDAELPTEAPTEPAAELGDHPRVLSEGNGVRITTLPTDDIAEYLEEMPDGIHLRPGVQLHQIDPSLLSHIEISRHVPIVRITGPALNVFANVNPNDGVFLGNYAFIVEEVAYEDGLITLEVSTFELTRVIWGNFRIEYDLPMTALFDSEDDISFEPLVNPFPDSFGNVTRTQASVTASAIAKTFKEDFDIGSVSGEFSGTLRVPYQLQGVFEGRIGSFKEEYRCKKAPRDKYCVDRIAAYVELSMEFTGKAKVEFGRQATYNTPSSKQDIVGPVTLAVIPLGATGLSVNPAFFVRQNVEAKAVGMVGLEYEFTYSKTAPVGFEYRDLPNSHPEASGLYTIPNSRFPVQDHSKSHTLKPTGSFSAEAEARLEIGVELQLAFGNVPAKLIGPEVKGVAQAEFLFSPFARDSEGYCTRYGAKLFGEAVAKLEFEVDLWLWKVEKELTCDNCSVQSTAFDLIGPHTSSEWCLDSPSYDTLTVQFASGGPAGINSPPGYPIDAICVDRPNGTSFCANNGGGSAAHGRPDATTCDGLNGGKAYPLTGTRDFKFTDKIRPGHVIRVVQSSVSSAGGICNPGGRAIFSLKGSGFPTVSFNNGNYYEGSPTLTVPQ